MALPFRLKYPSQKKYIPKHKKTELGIHQRVCRYLDKNYPHIIYHSDYAAGLHLSEHQASVNKSIQSGPGFPDLTIYAKSRGYTGLALELKADGVTVILKTGQNKGRLTSNPHIRLQASVLRKLNDEGWYANFAIGYHQATHIIDWYFERPQNHRLFDEI